MRIMSFHETTNQIRGRSKDVTRRIGWAFLKPGEKAQAVDQSPRLGKGYEVLAVIQIVSVRAERLSRITKEEVVREGFPELTPEDFVEMFCMFAFCKPDQIVQRIEFKYLEIPGGQTT